MGKDVIFDSESSKGVVNKIAASDLREDLEKMIFIRQFELRAENAYREGHIGGFFHSYIGQEAIQTAAIRAMGKEHWWSCSYRCHAIALLLGVSAKEVMSELFGKVTGNALGRGGSMHLYSDRLLGGYGIVGGQIPIATGAALSLKKQRSKNAKDPYNEISVCFLGDGAVAQGAFHESLNLAALWDLPCLYVIENNQWGMGTAVERAIAALPMGVKQALSYDIDALEVDGMDYFACHSAFTQALQRVARSGRPLLMEVQTQRFQGHSISDPGHYRSKEELITSKKRDPIDLMEQTLLEKGLVGTSWREEVTQKATEQIKEALDYAESSPYPHSSTLEEGVYHE